VANYILKKRADQDLQEIWEYTNNKWGEKQARKYLEQLEARFVLLAENSQLGILRDDIFESYYSFVE
jgi:toxin ParE1/3/4